MAVSIRVTLFFSGKVPRKSMGKVTCGIWGNYSLCWRADAGGFSVIIVCGDETGGVINGQWLWANFAEARRREQRVLAIGVDGGKVGLRTLSRL